MKLPQHFFLYTWLIFAGSFLDPATPEPFQMYILHTNDVHSRFEMFNRRDVRCHDKPDVPYDQVPEKQRCYGGIVRRAGFINEFRRKHKNVLLLDAGDQFQGTPWFYIYKGAAASHFLNRLEYDAMALGNHEFDNGIEGLDPFLTNVTVPVLCANLVMDDKVTPQIKRSLKKSVVLERGGKKIGVIGYITHTVPSLAKTGDLSFENEKDVLKKESSRLKKDGIDIIIAVGHAGLKVDKEMAGELEDVDVIVGGHSHSLLYTGNNAYGDEVAGDYPQVFKHAEGKTTLVVQAGCFGKYVGVLNLTFNGKGELTNWSGKPVAMDHKIPEDKEIKMEMEYLNQNVSSAYKKVVGQSLVILDTSENICRIRECEIGNLYTDAMIDQFKDHPSWNNLTIAFTSGGTFRSSIGDGNITFGSVLAVLPFGNDIVIVDLSGKTLLDVLEHSVKGFDLAERNGKFLQISGLQVTYNMTKPDNHKVSKVMVRDCYQCPGFKPLNTSLNYFVVLPSYLINGGDGYLMLKEHRDRVINVDAVDNNVLLDYLKKYSPVSAKLENRLNGLETYPGWTEVIKKYEQNNGYSDDTKNNLAVSLTNVHCHLETVFLVLAGQFVLALMLPYLKLI